MRATAATLLLDAGVDIKKVQDLLGHRHITTTHVYDKRGIAASQSARTTCRYRVVRTFGLRLKRLRVVKQPVERIFKMEVFFGGI
jgi:hypothetical protein